MEVFFKKFLINIKLTDLQKEDAKTKTKSVCKALHNKYYPSVEYNGGTKFLVGSYGKYTNIRPPKDIDVIFKLPEEEFFKYDSLSGNKQSQLLQDVRSILKDTFSTTDKITAFGKVIVINFSEGSHSVELLPAWQLESGSFRIPNTENGGSWDVWSPLAEAKNIDQSSVATKCTRSLIRILKVWVTNNGTSLKSFVLEILVVDYLKEKHSNEVLVTYPELVLGFFEFLKEKKNGSILLPASGTLMNIGEDWYSRAETACSRSEKAITFENEGKQRDASLEWRKVFGNDFPVAEDISDSALSKVSELTKLYPSDKEEGITSTYGIPVRIVSGYQVEMDADVTQNGFRPGLLSSFLNKRFPLLKGKKLKFKITHINIPTPYKIMWKVRNFGDEARRAGGLRGEITEDFGFNTKEENTLYHGEHYVECYAIKDGVCIAMDKVLVPIGKEHE
jgi:hypothetical protein